MKKAIFLFIFFIIPAGLISQTYSIVVGGEPWNPDNLPKPSGHVIEASNSSGQIYEILDTDVDDIYSGIHAYDVPFRPTIIQVRQKASNTICYTRNISTCTSNSYEIITFCNTTFQWKAYTTSVNPNITIENVTSEPSPICGKYTFQATPNWSPWHYQWEYKIGTGNWTSFNGSSGNWSSKLEFGISDVPGLGYNEAIQVRLNKCSYFGVDKGTSIYTVSFISCSPHLDSFNTVDTQCSYSIDGGFTAIFDRALNSGERMIMSLYEVDALGNEVLVAQQDTDILDVNNGYTWPFPLPSGDYLVKYQADNNGTFSSLEPSIPFTIGSPDTLIFSAAKGNDVTCFGGSDGSIQLSASGGVPGYEFMVEKNGSFYQGWTAFSGSNTHTLVNLPAGRYKLYLRDANQCYPPFGDGTEKTITIDIIQPAGALALNFVNSYNPEANGFTDGSVIVDMDGGTRYGDGSYQLEWKNSSGTVLSSVSNEVVTSGYRTTLNNIGAGNYTLTVTDSKGCAITATYTITEPPALSLEVQESNSISCNSNNTYGDPSSDGELMVVASGGVPFDPALPGGNLYKYTWKKKDVSGNWQVLIGVTGPVASGLPAGDYAVNIEDANGIVIGTYQNNSLLQVTDVEYSLLEPPLLNIELTKQDVFCPDGSDGSVTANITGGTGTYNIFWNTGDTTPAINSLSGGTYTIQVSDERGCRAESSIVVNEPQQPLQVSYTGSQPTFSGATDGWIKVVVTGGTPYGDNTYDYRWEDAGANSMAGQVTTRAVSGGYELMLNNIGAGSYYLTVEDQNYSLATDKTNCTISQSEYILEEPAPLALSVVEQTPISCNSSNTYGDPSSDGELMAVATGGVPFDPALPGGNLYKYTWKKKDISGNWQQLTGVTGPLASGLSAGTYAINIEDANGIVLGTYQNNTLVQTTDVEYALLEPPLLNIELSKQDVLCPGGGDGSVTATITGGTGAYSISWNTGDTTPVINNLSGGTYTIQVTDERGCRAESSIVLNEPQQALQVSYTESKPSFSGANDGWIKATVTGGTPFSDDSYNYNWEDAGANSMAGQVTARVISGGYELLLNNIGAGSYYLTVEDKNYSLATNKTNCTIAKSEYILVDPAPLSLMVVEQKSISCNTSNTYGDPSADGILEAVASGGVSLGPGDNGGLSYYYTWKKFVNANWEVLPNQTSNIASNLSAGLYAVNIKDANGIVIGTYQNNVLVQTNDVEYTLKDPPLLELSFNSQDVYCFEGSDGWAEAVVTGGIPPYNFLWSNNVANSKITDLSEGTYDLTVTDSRGCQVSGSVNITSPAEPVQVTYLAFSRPTSIGSSDAWLSAEITGGTALTDGTYNFTWKDEIGSDLGGQVTATVAADGTYLIQLDDIPAGSYYLTIEDANYNAASTKDGCTLLESTFELVEPIEASIEEVLQISCNSANTFENPFSDGVLIASVQGGVPFETDQPYIYHWKKRDLAGNWVELPQQTSEIAMDLSVGDYALNVEDSQGNVMGLYQSNTLVQATDEVYSLSEPELLTLSMSGTPISCGAGDDGTATVQISGGSGNYSIEWSNGATTTTTTNLIAGTYFVHVMDEQGCEATEQITIEQPGGLDIAVTTQKAPSCYQGTDGMITINVTGGSSPYNYLWNNGATGTALQNLTEGTYQVRVIDANGCVAFKEVTLEDPEQITLKLGEDRTLCNGQEYYGDISINDVGANYLWQSDNGFSNTSPVVSLTEAGTYTATVTNSAGCVSSDTITIATSTTDIDSQFVVSTQAFVREEIIIVNTSNPISAQAEWILPEEAQIIQESPENITLLFSQVGVYEVTLRTFQGECYQDFSKPVVVEYARNLPDVGDTETPFLEEFVVYPNPNNGKFEVSVSLAEPASVSLRLFSQISSTPLDDRLLHGSGHYNTHYEVSLPSGVYTLLLETSKIRDIRRIVIE